MAHLPLFCHRSAKHLNLWLRGLAYDNMARQASGWALDAVKTTREDRNRRPVEIDFEVPQKHRLDWICRIIHHRHQ